MWLHPTIPGGQPKLGPELPHCTLQAVSAKTVTPPQQPLPQWRVGSSAHQCASNCHSWLSQPDKVGASPAYQCTHSSHSLVSNPSHVGSGPAHHCTLRSHSWHSRPMCLGPAPPTSVPTIVTVQPQQGVPSPCMGRVQSIWIWSPGETALLGSTRCLRRRATPSRPEDITDLLNA